jgi:hypothetical protein
VCQGAWSPTPVTPGKALETVGRQDAAHPGLADSARCTATWLCPGRGMVLRGRYSCGPRGRGSSRAGQCRRMPTVGRCPGGAQSFAPGIDCGRRGRRPSPTCRSSQGHPAIGCGFRFRRGARGLPFLADRKDAAPPMGTLWEGHSPLCPIFLRTAGTPSLPDLSELARAPGHRVWLQVP